MTIGVFIDDVQITKAKGRNSTEAQNEAAIMFLKTGEYKEKYLEIIGAPVNLTDKAAKAKYEDIMKFSWSHWVQVPTRSVRESLVASMKVFWEVSCSGKSLEGASAPK